MADLSRIFRPEDDSDSWRGDFNPYYNPEKCGLELLSVVDVPDLSYEFDTIILVKDKESGELFAAQDSGCSCPVPFEDVKGLGDMTQIKSVDDFKGFVKSYETYEKYDTAQVRSAVMKVRNRTKTR